MGATTKMDAIVKLRAITNWCDWEHEDINFRYKSIRDIEKAYDFCKKNGAEFVSNLEDDDRAKLSKKLGYNI